MYKIIYVVYLDNRHTNPTGLKAFKWEAKARDYIAENEHIYPQRLRLMTVPLED